MGNKADNTKDHQKLVEEILLNVGSRPNIRCWIRSVGVGRALHSNNVISWGMKGESDLQGIIAPSGRMLAIEVKTGSGELSKEQIRFRDMVIKFGGLHILARSLLDVTSILDSNL